MIIGLNTMLTQYRADINNRTGGIGIARTLNESLFIISKSVETYTSV
jgi:hypothetical protein